MLDLADAVQLEEAHGVGQHERSAHRVELGVRQLDGEVARIPVEGDVGAHGAEGAGGVLGVVDARGAGAHLDHRPALPWQKVQLVVERDHVEAARRLLAQDPADEVALAGQRLVQGEDHVVRLEHVGVVFALQLLAPRQLGLQHRREARQVLGAGCHETHRALIVPRMRQPARELPRLRLRRVVDKDELELVVAVERDELRRDAARQAHGLVAGADDAHDRLLEQRHRHRHVGERLGLLGQCEHDVLQVVVVQRELARRVLDLGVEVAHSHAQPEPEEVAVTGSTLPETPLAAMDTPHAVVQGHDVLGEDVALAAALRLDPCAHVVDVGTVLGLALGLALSLLAALLAARQDRPQDHAGHHRQGHDESRDRLHDVAAAVRPQDVDHGEDAHEERGDAHSERRPHHHQHRHLVQVGELRRRVDGEHRRLDVPLEARRAIEQGRRAALLHLQVFPCLGLLGGELAEHPGVAGHEPVRVVDGDEAATRDDGEAEQRDHVARPQHLLAHPARIDERAVRAPQILDRQRVAADDQVRVVGGDEPALEADVAVGSAADAQARARGERVPCVPTPVVRGGLAAQEDLLARRPDDHLIEPVGAERGFTRPAGALEDPGTLGGLEHPLAGDALHADQPGLFAVRGAERHPHLTSDLGRKRHAVDRVVAHQRQLHASPHPSTNQPAMMTMPRRGTGRPRPRIGKLRLAAQGSPRSFFRTNLPWAMGYAIRRR